MIGLLPKLTIQQQENSQPATCPADTAKPTPAQEFPVINVEFTAMCQVNGWALSGNFPAELDFSKDEIEITIGLQEPPLGFVHLDGLLFRAFQSGLIVQTGEHLGAKTYASVPVNRNPSGNDPFQGWELTQTDPRWALKRYEELKEKVEGNDNANQWEREAYEQIKKLREMVYNTAFVELPYTEEESEEGFRNGTKKTHYEVVFQYDESVYPNAPLGKKLTLKIEVSYLPNGFMMPPPPDDMGG